MWIGAGGGGRFKIASVLRSQRRMCVTWERERVANAEELWSSRRAQDDLSSRRAKLLLRNTNDK